MGPRRRDLGRRNRAAEDLIGNHGRGMTWPHWGTENERCRGTRVVEHLGVDADKVVESANFIDDLGADSLDTVELVMAFEEEFGVEIPDDQAETITTVGDAVKFLEKASAK